MRTTFYSIVLILFVPFSVCLAQGDQTLIYASYFGGSAEEGGTEKALDVKSNTWINGTYTLSYDIPITPNAFQNSLAGGIDGFIGRFSLNGDLEYGTYLGGSANDFVNALKFFPGSNGFVVSGFTKSPDFPVTPSSHIEDYQGNGDVYVSRFDEQGQLLWSTYFGAQDMDKVTDMVLDASGSIFIVGNTYSPGLATPGVHQFVYAENRDAFLAKFDSSGNLLWSTYFGGEGSDTFNAVEISLDGLSVYCMGSTNSDQNIAYNGWQMARGGSSDAMIAKFNTLDGSLNWSSYYGGEENDFGKDLSISQAEKIFIIGETNSETNIASINSHQPSLAGFSDVFLVCLDLTGDREWGTYFGGDHSEEATRLTLEGESIVLVGHSGSDNNIAYGFPIDAGGINGGSFMAKFEDTGQIFWGTYFLSDRPVGLNTIAAIPESSKILGIGAALGSIDMTDIITPDAEQPVSAGNVDLLFFLFEDNTVSTQEYFVEPLSIYPNPSSGLITINRPDNLYESLNFEIIDIAGKTVFQKTIESPTLSVNVSNLAGGTYLIRAVAVDKLFRTKLVIE